MSEKKNICVNSEQGACSLLTPGVSTSYADNHDGDEGNRMNGEIQTAGYWTGFRRSWVEARNVAVAHFKDMRSRTRGYAGRKSGILMPEEGTVRPKELLDGLSA